MKQIEKDRARKYYNSLGQRALQKEWLKLKRQYRKAEIERNKVEQMIYDRRIQIKAMRNAMDDCLRTIDKKRKACHSSVSVDMVHGRYYNFMIEWRELSIIQGIQKRGLANLHRQERLYWELYLIVSNILPDIPVEK